MAGKGLIDCLLTVLTNARLFLFTLLLTTLLVDSSVTAPLVQILQATLSTDAATRRAAESTFLTGWVPQPDRLFPALLAIMQNAQFPEEIRSSAAVFFRRWIARPVSSGEGSAQEDEDSSAAFFHLADPKAIQTGLLTAFTTCTSKVVRNRVADAIGQVATVVAPYEEWRELVQLIITSLQGGRDLGEAAA